MKKKIKKQKPGDSFVEINQTGLDWEWSRQPKLVRDFGFRVAEAKKNHSEAKANFDLVKADLSIKIRFEPKEYGINKVSEDTIKAAVILQDEYQEAERAVIRSRYLVDELEAVTNALEHRKYALQDLVKLELADYHSTLRAPEGAEKRMTESGKRMARSAGTKRRDDG